MIEPKKFYCYLKGEGISFFTGVPDSLLNDFCLYLSDNISKEEHIIAANEGNAIGIATGSYLATGKTPLVYMQNSGIGNALNPLISLTNKETYSIPMVLLIGWRGAPGTNDWTHHKKQGEESPRILETLDIPYKELNTTEDEEVLEMIQWATKTACEKSSPVALLANKGVLEKGQKKDLLLEESELTMSREEAIETIIKTVPKDALFVATTGRATREIYEVRNKCGMNHDHDFLNVGSMGHASSIVAGIAMGQKERLVVCLDGDAAALMHMGAMPIIGSSGLSNILHVVLNNGVHESVGGQPSIAHKINFTGVAKSVGYQTIEGEVKTKKGLVNAINRLLLNEKKPAFIDMHIRQGIRKDIPKLDVSLEEVKKNLMKAIKKTQ
ncbi:phosphonopyruvate decarboxylase [Proteinivorax hydrogeniformans]|uniref:Phosphonopyruvate decarboxylase n=1 Tax=Proteinivorax hydrogeniformans TaxID=1826727 RepID=A0AAU8HX17_9FIRM